jgi:hypothetical protein
MHTPPHDTSITINDPPAHRLALVGGLTAGAILAWLAAFASVPTTASGDAPREVVLCLLAAALAFTGAAVHLGVAYQDRRVTAENQRSVAIAVGALAAEVEQLAQQVKKIDQWGVYATGYEDALKDGRRN